MAEMISSEVGHISTDTIIKTLELDGHTDAANRLRKFSNLVSKCYKTLDNILYDAVDLAHAKSLARECRKAEKTIYISTEKNPGLGDPLAACRIAPYLFTSLISTAKSEGRSANAVVRDGIKLYLKLKEENMLHLFSFHNFGQTDRV